ncbi:hypothetical protein O7635_13375 [Asanoa sp. WMMD1127]|uniref:hypothetical protein n=1 Tax=Asanoa sp. WMMD1127 TaxID=3016107 RepID=UPI002417B9D8|nr:hypothetical protein [Asanoa sp. WMMD1127]MDG4822841.1 hypothetical protein [Asanoa sp. WMMD1127]
MTVVGLLFLIGGAGVLLTMNRLLWPLDESDPAGRPGGPGRASVAGGRPGPARHPRQRLPTRATAARRPKAATAGHAAGSPPPAALGARPPVTAQRTPVWVGSTARRIPPPATEQAAPAGTSARDAAGRARSGARTAAQGNGWRPAPPVDPSSARRPASAPARTRQTAAAPQDQAAVPRHAAEERPPTSSWAQVRVVTVPDRAPAPAGGRVYGGGARRADGPANRWS